MIDFINVIFRYIDFLVIMIVGYFSITRYGLPIIEKLIREYEVFIYNLKSDSKNVLLQTQAIYENIQDKEQQFLAMQKKFIIWQKKSNLQKEYQQQEQQRIDLLVADHFALRSACLQNETMKQEQLPVIVDAATVALQKKYQAIDLQKQYIDELIHFMKEKS